jgi:hypothetical protein
MNINELLERRGELESRKSGLMYELCRVKEDMLMLDGDFLELALKSNLPPGCIRVDWTVVRRMINSK